jgi:hypothetical protein
MRKLVNKTNVDAPTFAFPFGRIRDNPGNDTGTPVDELLYGDMHQAFAILFAMAGVVMNDLEENSTNSFQSGLAFISLANTQNDFAHQIGTSLQPPYQNGWQGSNFVTSTGGARYMRNQKTDRVYFSGSCERGTENNGAIAFNLPVGYRPNDVRKIPILMRNNSIFYPGVMIIQTNGDVTFQCNAGNGTTLAVYILDGCSFNLTYM